jgi:hypothetical protein
VECHLATPSTYLCQCFEHFYSTLDPTKILVTKPVRLLFAALQNPIHSASTILREEGMRGMWSVTVRPPSYPCRRRKHFL